MIPLPPVIMGAGMRGLDERNEALFSYVNLEDRDRPLSELLQQPPPTFEP